MTPVAEYLAALDMAQMAKHSQRPKLIPGTTEWGAHNHQEGDAMTVSFSVSIDDLRTISKIAERAANLLHLDNDQVAMSLTACHANGCPLRLDDLSSADDFNLIHDVSGIHNTVSRETGKIKGLFRPRFAAKEG